MVVSTFFAVVIALAALPAPAQSGSAAVSVQIRGQAGQRVHVRALGVPAGFIAAFCTSRICARSAVTLTLLDSGRESIALHLLPQKMGAHPPRRLIVAVDGGPTASIAMPRARP